MTNLLMISGRITKDLDPKQTQSGKTVLPFDVAVQREYKNKSTNEYDTDFIPCLAVGNTADFLIKHANKGYFVSVQGRLQNNNYERKDGTTNYGQQMIVSQVDAPLLFLNKNENGNQNVSQGQQTGNNNQQTGNAAEDNPFANNNGSVDIQNSDLPFS